MKLTGKQEKFAQAIASGMSQSDAYRDAYATKSMTDKQVWEEASKLANGPKVAQRVAAIQAEIAAKTVEKTAITREDLIAELEEARMAAMGGERPQAGAAVAATVAKGKLLGLQVDKVEHSGMVATMDVAAGLTDSQKIAAAKAILVQAGVFTAMAQAEMERQGYTFED